MIPIITMPPLFRIFQIPTSLMDIITDLAMFITPLWIAVIVGVVVGWAWKPKWAFHPKDALLKFRSPRPPNPQNDTAFTYSATRFANCRILMLMQMQMQHLIIFISNFSSSAREKDASGSPVVTEDDLLHLWKLVEEKDGGPAWIQMMDRSTPTMRYQAWRRDPEVRLTLLDYFIPFVVG